MDFDAIIRALGEANQLKRTARTGWVQRGVPEAENVAGHSYGVAFITLTLAGLLDEPIELGRALSLAILHDLPEARTTDIPPSAWGYLPEGAKSAAEMAALQDMLAGLPLAEEWLALWLELKAGETIEARLVLDADRLDLYLQALVYEQQSGNRRLAEFWQRSASFHFPICQALYEALMSRRPSGR